uniref:Uncharacterized protein n=1 Tax=Aegilops tauschii subsp. strangulata TaxID=200361 RepID=A0A453BDQ6_AEGTS
GVSLISGRKRCAVDPYSVGSGVWKVKPQTEKRRKEMTRKIPQGQTKGTETRNAHTACAPLICARLPPHTTSFLPIPPRFLIRRTLAPAI